MALRVAFGAIAFLVAVLLARMLGKEEFGRYNYAFAWVIFLGAPAVLGLDQLLVREVATYQENANWPLMRGLLRATNLIVLLCSSALALIAAVVALLLRGPRATDTTTFLVALILLPLVSLTRLRQGVLQGLHRVVLASIPERLIQPSLLLLFVAAAYFSHVRMTARIAMALNVLSTTVAFGVGAGWLYRVLPASVKQARPIYQAKAWARSAMPMLYLAGVGVLFAQTGILILGVLKGAGVVGSYSVAAASADLMTFILVAMNAAFASTVASLYANRDLERLQRLTTRLARLTLLATLPLAVLFLGFGEWFLRLAYGNQYTVATTALAVLSFGQLVNVGTGLNGMLLIMTGHEGSAAIVVGAGAGANVVLNLLLVPRWGLEGAAVAFSASLIMWNVLATVVLWRKTGLYSTPLGPS